MKRLMNVIAGVLMVCGVAWAEGDCTWWHVPATYMSGVCKLSIPAKAACNTGQEKFSTFLSKFNGDVRFRIERTRVSGNTCRMPDTRLLREAAYAAEECGLFPLRGSVVRETRADRMAAGCEYLKFGYWYGISRDRVVYNTCYSTVGEPDYKGIILLFERIDGKWYCTDADAWGAVDERLRRFMKN